MRDLAWRHGVAWTILLHPLPTVKRLSALRIPQASGSILMEMAMTGTYEGTT